MYKLARCNNRPRFDAKMQSLVFRTFTKQTNKIYNIIIIVNEAAELRSNRFIMTCNVLENFSNLRNPLFFLPNLGLSNTPYLGSGVTVLHLLLVVRGQVIQSLSVGRGIWITFVELLLRI